MLNHFFHLFSCIFFWSKRIYLFLHFLSLAQPFHTNCNHLLCGMVSPITTIIFVIGYFGGVISLITIANNFSSFFVLFFVVSLPFFSLFKIHVFFLLFCLKFFLGYVGHLQLNDNFHSYFTIHLILHWIYVETHLDLQIFFVKVQDWC